MWNKLKGLARYQKRHAMNQAVLDQGVKIIGGEMQACNIRLRMKGMVITYKMQSLFKGIYIYIYSTEPNK